MCAPVSGTADSREKGAREATEVLSESLLANVAELSSSMHPAGTSTTANKLAIHPEAPGEPQQKRHPGV